MHADANIQVWLETMQNVRPAVIIPYAKSESNLNVSYRIQAVRTSAQGKSQISQGGAINLPSGTPIALGRMSLSRNPGDACEVEIVFSYTNIDNDKEERRYILQCPE